MPPTPPTAEARTADALERIATAFERIATAFEQVVPVYTEASTVDRERARRLGRRGQPADPLPPPGRD